jgi:uncharacterized protein
MAVAVFAMAAVSCGRGHPLAAPDPPPRPTPSQMVAIAPGGETVVMEVAASEEQRMRGLMGRSEVPRGTGMYFRFDEPGIHSFWMLHCLVPLDIVWLDAAGIVVYVGESLPPCQQEPCPTYAPPAPAAQVIEVAAGEARRMGIVPGARVLLKPVTAGQR